MSVKQVVSGSSPEKIIIILEQPDDQEAVIIWDISIDTEDGSSLFDKDYEIIWDESGQPYVVSQDKIWFSHANCNLKCFDNSQV